MMRLTFIVLMMLFAGLSVELTVVSGEEVSDGSKPLVAVKLLSKEEANALIRQEKERFWEVWRTLEKFKMDQADRKRALEVKRRQFNLLKRKVNAGLTALSHSPTSEYVIRGIPYSSDSVKKAVDVEADNLIRLDSEMTTLVRSIGNQSVLIDNLQIKLAESERAQTSLNDRIEALQVENEMAGSLRRLSEAGHQLDTQDDRQLREYARNLQISTAENLKKAGIPVSSQVPLEKLSTSNIGDFVDEKILSLEAAGINIGPIGNK